MTMKQAGWTPAQQELLGVYGFDLMAQVEALLRHVREYQREVQRLGRVGRQSSKGIQAHLQQIRHVCTSVRETLDLIAHAEQGPAQQPPDSQPGESFGETPRQ